MSKRKTQTYTPEYRSEAIKLVLEQGLSVSEAVTRLSMGHGTLTYWVTQARQGVKSASSVAGAQSSAELAAENKLLRKRLAEDRVERDIIRNLNRQRRMKYESATSPISRPTKNGCTSQASKTYSPAKSSATPWGHA